MELIFRPFCHVLRISASAGQVPLHRVNFSARTEYEKLQNLKILQDVFAKCDIKRAVDIKKLVNGKFQDNMEFCQWLKHFHSIKTSRAFITASLCQMGFSSDSLTFHSPIEPRIFLSQYSAFEPTLAQPTWTTRPRSDATRRSPRTARATSTRPSRFSPPAAATRAPRPRRRQHLRRPRPPRCRRRPRAPRWRVQSSRAARPRVRFAFGKHAVKKRFYFHAWH